MVAFPPCKINLGLHVLGKRADGYHDLETCFYPVPWTDILEIIPSSEFLFTSSGSTIPGDASDNLCIKAYRLLADAYTLPPVHIHLHKIIPTGAGLGGGSSDAAHILTMLNQLFELKLSLETLAGFAAKLGSDCAFFLYETAMIGTGRGEILEPVSITLADMFLVIVKPSVHVATADAYAGITPALPEVSLRAQLSHPVGAWKDRVKNDFEETIFKKYPAIRSVKEMLYTKGAVYASMSGSGAAVFGIFDKEVDLKETFHGSEYWAGPITV